MSDGSIRSQLEPLAPFSHEADDSHARRAMATAWHRDGIVMFRIDDFRQWTDREQARILAEKLYGKRMKQSG